MSPLFICADNKFALSFAGRSPTRLSVKRGGAAADLCPIWYIHIIYIAIIPRARVGYEVYSLSDLGVSSNLIGSLSRTNWALSYGVNNAWSKQNKTKFLNRKYWENKMMLCYRIQREPQNLVWKFPKVGEEFILLPISVWLRFCK